MRNPDYLAIAYAAAVGSIGSTGPVEFTADLIVEGALDDSFELADMEAVEALAKKLRAEAQTEDWAGELHFRPAHVESAGEFADDGSGVIPISGEARPCG